MGQLQFLSDNHGNLVAPDMGMIQPITATGIEKTLTGGDANDTVTVVADTLYAVNNSHATETLVLGILDATVAANVVWACPPVKTILVHMPLGETTLHMSIVAAATPLIRLWKVEVLL